MRSRQTIRRRAAHLATGAVLGALALVGTTRHVSATHSTWHAPKRKCNSLAHVGDSLTYAARAPLAHDYAARGWTDFRIDAKGGRGIASFMYDDITGLEAVKRIKASGFNGCWVMALGTNDTGNADTLVKDPAAQAAWRVGLIRAMMDELDGAPVMWVNTHLISPTFDYSSSDAAAWNEALLEVQPEYPNMLVFDWDAIAAAHPEWTTDDLIHDTPEGSAQRAEFVTLAATRLLREFDPVAAGGRHVVRTDRSEQLHTVYLHRYD